jgi:hypothetical protein
MQRAASTGFSMPADEACTGDCAKSNLSKQAANVHAIYILCFRSACITGVKFSLVCFSVSAQLIRTALREITNCTDIAKNSRAEDVQTRLSHAKGKSVSLLVESTTQEGQIGDVSSGRQRSHSERHRCARRRRGRRGNRKETTPSLVFDGFRRVVPSRTCCEFLISFSSFPMFLCDVGERVYRLA